MALNSGMLEVAYRELGVRETPGAPSNPRITAYHGATDGGPALDEVPWCSAFLCWCAEQAGVKHPRSKRARSWLLWGYPIQFPHEGCVVVLKRGVGSQPGPEVQNASGHVGLFVGFDAGSRLLMLGGNQGDEVSIQAFPIVQVLGYRQGG